MKRILSVLLCAALLAAGMTFAASAEDVVDKAMLLDDISVTEPERTGSMGYINNTEKENDFGVKAWGSDELYNAYDKNGISIAFDLNVIASSQCTHLVSEVDPNGFRHVQGLVFAFSSERDAVIYDIANQEFQIARVGWPSSVVPLDRSHIMTSVEKSSGGVDEIVVKAKKFAMDPGEWHRIFVLVQGTEVTLYVDGEELLFHDFSGGANGNLTRDFLMFWESHCRLMIDNMVVGTDEYDDRNGVDANEGNILFIDDFNDAVAPVYDHSEKEPAFEIEKDKSGKEIYYPAFEEDGITPKTDKYGNQLMETHFALDGEGNKIPELDDKGEQVMHDKHYYRIGDEIVDEYGLEHAGFVWGRGVTNDGNPNVPCYGVDKATYSGMIKDVDGAAIAFADTGATEGQTVNAAITIGEGAGFTKASNLTLSLDPIFTFKGFENVAEGASITEADGKVEITLPAGFTGKLADLVLEIPAEKEMAQSCRYRYGFIVGADATFEGADAASVTVDGGFTYTQNFVKGDCDGNGKLNAKDVTLLMKYNVIQQDVSRGKTPTEKQQAVIDSLRVKAADVYPDEKINARDVKVLMKYLVDPSAGWGTK